MPDPRQSATRFPELITSAAPPDGDAAWEIRPSPIAGSGLFGRRSFQINVRVIEYLGEVINNGQAEERRAQGNHFIFHLTGEQYLDGNVAANPARLANHSCDPNCEARCVAGHIWLVAIRAIAPGEELTFDYGYDLDDYRDHPCNCRTRHCTGYIVAEALRGWLRKDMNTP